MAFTLAIHPAHGSASRRKFGSSYLLLGAIFGVVGGLLAMLLVPCLSLCAWWLLDPQLSRLSTFVAYTAIPLLLLGASCLDWYEQAARKKS